MSAKPAAHHTDANAERPRTLTLAAIWRRVDRVCGCPSDALCAVCLEGRFAQLRGVAACRGERWADELRDVRGAPAVWPVESEKVRRLAAVKVADLARDRRLLEMLRNELVTWAAKRWASALVASA